MENNAKETGEMVAYVPPELEELVPWFVGNMRQNLEQMEQSIQKGDLETVRAIGHDMKGVGKSYGFDGISDIGKMLENAVIEKNTEEICRGLEHFAVYIENVEIIITKD